MYTPPGVPRSRSLTRFTMRVGLEHLGQSVLLLVSMTFLRSPVLAIFAIMLALPGTNVAARALDVLSNCHPLGQAEWNHPVLLVKIVRDLSTAGIGWRRTAIEALLQVYTTIALAASGSTADSCLNSVRELFRDWQNRLQDSYQDRLQDPDLQ
jgi:hypothetical protein